VRLNVAAGFALEPADPIEIAVGQRASAVPTDDTKAGRLPLAAFLKGDSQMRQTVVGQFALSQFRDP
jgi:hypothetical protein